MGKYFGTDGIRGVYGKSLDTALAFKAGRAIARHFGAGGYIIVRDTRESGPALEDAVAGGINAGGGEALTGGVLPTPAAAYLLCKHKARAGIVISASHNPPEYNGIKVFGPSALKIDEAAEAAIETLIESAEIIAEKTGARKILTGAREDYIKYLTEQAPAELGGLKVFLDCCFGATAGIAKEVFSRLGASVTAFNDTPDGKRINCGCGAVHPEVLAEKMTGEENAVGFSFDGDGDRLSVARGGSIIDGDTVLYNIASSMELRGGAVCGTVLSNLALEEALAEKGINFYRTPVGDKYIANLIFEKNLTLGGEQSGHYIINSDCLTGDGILTALYLLKFLYKGGKLLPHLALTLCPQKQLNFRAEKSVLSSAGFRELLRESENLLGSRGRIIARMSGTEPVLRVMIEGRDGALVEDITRRFNGFFAG